MKLLYLSLLFGIANSLAFTLLFISFVLGYYAYEPTKWIAILEASLAFGMLIVTIVTLIKEGKKWKQ